MQKSSCDDVFDNVDLLTEILLRLPPKHVLRCMFVCRKWFSLISDPKFIHSHTLRLCQNPYPESLLLPRSKIRREAKSYIVPFTVPDGIERSPLKTLSLNFEKNLKRTRSIVFGILPASYRFSVSIIRSCNGLLLYCCKYYFGGRRLRPSYSYRVCNIATGHCVTLGFPKGRYFQYASMPYLAFEPLRSPHYKVILFEDRNESGHEPVIRIAVYSSETGSWSEVRVSCSANVLDVFRRSGVYCSGAIHWYSHVGKDLVYFDVDSLCFNKVSGLAVVESNDSCVTYFGESGGHLHLILANNDLSLDFDIWEMKEDYSGWNVRYHVDLTLMMGDGNAIRPFSVLCVVRQANEEHSMIVLFVDSKIMSYNLKDHTSRIILNKVDRVFGAFQYFDTISCVGLNYERLQGHLSME